MRRIRRSALDRDASWSGQRVLVRGGPGMRRGSRRSFGGDMKRVALLSVWVLLASGCGSSAHSSSQYSPQPFTSTTRSAGAVAIEFTVEYADHAPGHAHIVYTDPLRRVATVDAATPWKRGPLQYPPTRRLRPTPSTTPRANPSLPCSSRA